MEDWAFFKVRIHLKPWNLWLNYWVEICVITCMITVLECLKKLLISSLGSSTTLPNASEWNPKSKKKKKKKERVVFSCTFNIWQSFHPSCCACVRVCVRGIPFGNRPASLPHTTTHQPVSLYVCGCVKRAEFSIVIWQQNSNKTEWLQHVCLYVVSYCSALHAAPSAKTVYFTVMWPVNSFNSFFGRFWSWGQQKYLAKQIGFSGSVIQPFPKLKNNSVLTAYILIVT